ncbi:5-oxoprolinase subunit PxpB [Siphonobacter sp. SORGH_AS_0500]|uniref:5-oxoprolinase subunit PxpB n=1 Tax=Siphonobacter sp. SORGH_AS_0500 TaxID=1864824 RepID=UPI002859C41B|nr:5-oxoprolinase subunit PxpB [Siphonobacter sp. SORGH_AS_0500]MDR6197548.1 inhibitor of KinA [Siphonobacter sp. SORGH_AS_0500]
MLLPQRIYQLSEKALTLAWETRIDPEISAQVRRVQREILAQPFPGLTEVVPAYASLTVFYDPVLIRKNHPGQTATSWVENWLRQQMHTLAQDQAAVKPRRVDIPVCYGGDLGPDLAEVAHHCGLSPEAVIEQHSQAVYQVYMLGFVPGFAYMGGLPESLHTPRKMTPRAQVPAGSVGIAGAQTGIYPMTIPGGWQIIGRTSLPLFHISHTPPALLQAGDEIRFIPVDSL